MKVLILVLSLLFSFSTLAKKGKWPTLVIGQAPQSGTKCNMIFYTTSSMTSSSSTSSDSCDYIVPVVKNKEQELRRFVDINHDILMEEMSQGEGTVLTDYATLLGCSGAGIEVFKKTSQRNFTKIYSNVKDSDDVLKNTRTELNSEPAIRGLCQIALTS